jgi:hypothetical protein
MYFRAKNILKNNRYHTNKWIEGVCVYIYILFVCLEGDYHLTSSNLFLEEVWLLIVMCQCHRKLDMSKLEIVL